jgi:tetratricopeptide (TPR) repeat protein
MVIANRDNELAAFRDLVRPDTQKRILLISGPTGSGKSFLLEKFESVCSAEEFLGAALAVRLDGHSIPNFGHLFYQIQRELEERENYKFENFEAAQQILRISPSVTFDGNQISGPFNASFSLPGNEQAWKSPSILRGFFRDLDRPDKIIVLLFDQFTCSNDELAAWIYGPFLSDVRRSKNIRVVLAGETSLPENSQWDGCSTRLPSLGPINDIQKWLRYSESRGLTFSRETVAALVEITEGCPKTLGRYFAGKISIVQNLLNRLPEDLTLAVWATAIPHWFNEAILKALLPEISTQAAELYQQLQQLHFVEVYQGKGHRISYLTRKQLLDRFWKEHPERFSQLSENVTDYFENQESSASRIEYLYHLSMTENRDFSYYEVLQKYSDELRNDRFRSVNLQLLIQQLREQVNKSQVNSVVKADIYNWLGEQRITISLEESLTYLGQALKLYEEASQLQDCARTCQSIGDHLKSIGQIEEALERYNVGLSLCGELNDSDGQARSLISIGNIFNDDGRYDQALSYYQQALNLYSSRSARADTLLKIGDVFRLLQQGQTAWNFYTDALELYEQVGPGDSLGQAQVYQRYGTLEQDPIQALDWMQRAGLWYQRASNLSSHSHHLIQYMAPAYINCGHIYAAINALTVGQNLAEKISHTALIQEAAQRLAALDSPPI